MRRKRIIPNGEKGQGTADIEEIKPAFLLAVSSKVSISCPGGKTHEESKRHIKDIYFPKDRMVKKCTQHTSRIEPGLFVMEKKPYTINEEDTSPGAKGDK